MLVETTRNLYNQRLYCQSFKERKLLHKQTTFGRQRYMIRQQDKATSVTGHYRQALPQKYQVMYTRSETIDLQFRCLEYANNSISTAATLS